MPPLRSSRPGEAGALLDSPPARGAPAQPWRPSTERKARYDHRLAALLVFALLGMSNWVYKWYDPAGIWNADTVADGFIALVEPGYLAARSRPHDELARRLARVEREVRAAQGALERARRVTRRG